MKWLLVVFLGIFGLAGFNLQGGDILPGTVPNPNFQCDKVKREVSEAYTSLNLLKQAIIDLTRVCIDLQDEIDYYQSRLNDPDLTPELRQAFQTMIAEMQADLNFYVAFIAAASAEIDKIEVFLDNAEQWIKDHCQETPMNGPTPDPNFP